MGEEEMMGNRPSIFRYYVRWLRMLRPFLRRKVGSWLAVRVCRFMQIHMSYWIAELGIGHPYEVLELQHSWKKRGDAWVEHGKWFLGSDSDHPDGVYAKSPSDIVCMTNEEWYWWFGPGKDLRGLRLDVEIKLPWSR